MKKIEGIKIFKNEIFKDKRGHFMEVYKKNKISTKELIFNCCSYSKKNVIRGLHIQRKNSQAKFLTVLKGSIFFLNISDFHRCQFFFFQYKKIQNKICTF